MSSRKFHAAFQKIRIGPAYQHFPELFVLRMLNRAVLRYKAANGVGPQQGTKVTKTIAERTALLGLKSTFAALEMTV
jgi:hypothetical protein